jgi:hypothetical protein
VTRTIAALRLALVLWVAGCGGPSKLDGDRLARDLPAAVVADHPELVTDVVCPPSIERTIGASFTCTALIAGEPVALDVVQVDDRGGVRVDVDRTLLDVGEVAADLAARLTRDVGVPTAVVCAGPPVRVLVVGDTLRCTATDPDGRERVFALTVEDDAGAVGIVLE